MRHFTIASLYSLAFTPFGYSLPSITQSHLVIRDGSSSANKVNPMPPQKSNANECTIIHDALASLGKPDYTNECCSSSKTDIECDSEGHITHIFWTQKGLKGTFPDVLTQLPKLKQLRLASNSITGEIPASIGKLVNLEVLSLYQNKLTGGLPDSISELKELHEFDVSFNQLNGSVLDKLDKLAHLSILSFENNRFIGGFQSSLNSWANLTQLKASSNLLTGPIPDSFSGLKEIQSIFLNDNRFDGEIPASIGKLETLVTLSLSNNNLTGGIPSSLGSLLYLQQLDLSSTGISGPMPYDKAGSNLFLNLVACNISHTNICAAGLKSHPGVCGPLRICNDGGISAGVPLHRSSIFGNASISIYPMLIDDQYDKGGVHLRPEEAKEEEAVHAAATERPFKVIDLSREPIDMKGMLIYGKNVTVGDPSAKEAYEIKCTAGEFGGFPLPNAPRSSDHENDSQASLHSKSNEANQCFVVPAVTGLPSEFYGMLASGDVSGHGFHDSKVDNLASEFENSGFAMALPSLTTLLLMYLAIGMLY